MGTDVQGTLPGVGNPRKTTTVRGYEIDEVKSALQKAIRRDQQEAAMFWAKEMAESDLSKALWRRLRVIAAEDCAGIDAVTFVSNCAHAAGQCRDHLLFGMRAALELARCEKDRTVDDYLTWFDHKLTALGDRSVLYSIPDEALGEHTRRGRTMGRSHATFYHVGSKLENEGAFYDKQYIRFLKAQFPLEQDDPPCD